MERGNDSGELQPSGLAVGKSDRAGLLRAGSPEAGHPSGLALRRIMAEGLTSFGRDPQIYCAIVEGLAGWPDEVSEWASTAAKGPDALREALAAAYLGLWRIDRFGKPHVALLQGQIGWPGLALAINGTHKIADPAATFAAREVAEGGVPGWGASYWLAAAPRRLGLYLALTGAKIDAALAYRIGWLTHRIAAAQFAGIKEQLSRGEPVDTLLDSLDLGPADSALDPVLGAIERCFSASDLFGILARLDTTQGPQVDWARATAAAMRAAPPLALAVTHRLLTAHGSPTLPDGLIMDFRVAMNGPAAPSQPDSIETVFEPPPSGDLVLPVARPPSIC